MTFSYSGDPQTGPRDTVRHLLGDTEETEALLSNESISFQLSQTADPWEAAWRLAEAAAAAAAKHVNTDTGGLGVDLAQRHAQLLTIAAQLRTQSGLRAQTPSVR